MFVFLRLGFELGVSLFFVLHGSWLVCYIKLYTCFSMYIIDLLGVALYIQTEQVRFLCREKPCTCCHLSHTGIFTDS